nr:Zgc:174642 protein [Danio rerio]
MAYIKEESEDVKIEETFTVKQEDLQEQTDLIEENEESKEEEHHVKIE